MSPRLRLGGYSLLTGVLLGGLGFALAVQVHSTRQSAARFPAARQDELVRILDDLSARSRRLQADSDDLRRTLDRLGGGRDQDSAALAEARRRAAVLAILAGTSAAHGPGVVLTLTDPEHKITADVVLDAIQELRDAGAETLQISSGAPSGGHEAVRIVASTAVVDRDGAVAVDGTILVAPYVITAVGDARTLDEAMGIPGGVLDTVAARAGARASVVQRSDVRIDALRPLATPRYARPAP